MKLLDVSRDQKYLYIHTNEGTRKQSLNWRGVDQLEKKCRSLIGHEIIHSTSGAWDSNVWFQDVTPNNAGQNIAPPTSDSSRAFDGHFHLVRRGHQSVSDASMDHQAQERQRSWSILPRRPFRGELAPKILATLHLLMWQQMRREIELRTILT